MLQGINLKKTKKIYIYEETMFIMYGEYISETEENWKNIERHTELERKSFIKSINGYYILWVLSAKVLEFDQKPMEFNPKRIKAFWRRKPLGIL